MKRVIDMQPLSSIQNQLVQQETTRYARHIRLKLIGIAFILILLASAWISYSAWLNFEQALIPEIDKKSVAIGRSIINVIERSLSFNIPYNELVEADYFLNNHLNNNNEIHYIAITNRQGKLLYHASHASHAELPLSDLLAPVAQQFIEQQTADTESRIIELNNYYNTTLPIRHNETTVSLLHLGVEKDFVQNKIKEMSFDIMTVSLISLLIVFEFLMFVISYNIISPIQLINRVISRAETGDFSSTIKTHSSDEVGIFIVRFDSIIQHINQRYEELNQRIQNISEQGQTQLKQLKERLSEKYQFAIQGKPKQLIENSLISIRIPIFLFMFAEELSRSFFPLYVQDLYQPIFGLSEEVVIGLPISLFMLVVAIAMPFAGRLSDRFGSRRIFLIALIPSAIGFLLTALAQSIYDLLIWRAFSAVGYGMMFIACQGYVAQYTTEKTRTQGMGMFVAAVMVAAMCGPPIGGILADQVGYRWVFVLSAVLAIPSALLVYYFLPSHDEETEKKPAGSTDSQRLKLSDLLLLSKNIRFVSLSLFGALPVKFALTGFIFYFIPLYLERSGNTQSEIGRVLMLYGLVAIFITPFAAKLADRFNAKRLFTVLAGFLSGISILLVTVSDYIFYAALGVGLLGAAHAIGISPQLALIPEICAKETQIIGKATVISLFRLIERVGAVGGSLVMASLLAWGGANQAALIVGLGLLACAFLLSLTFLLDRFTAKNQ